MLSYLYSAVAALISIVLHELSHGYVSTWLGDPTPKEEGRLSLNPLKHIDPLGLLALIICKVGWAKPVRVNPMYYKKPKRDMALVALAGPLCNLILALISSLAVSILSYNMISGTVIYIFYTFFLYLLYVNVGLCLFNLIPIPPLDGSKILGALLPDEEYAKFLSYERYGTFIIFALVLGMNILSRLGYNNILSDGVTYIAEFLINMWNAVLFDL